MDYISAKDAAEKWGIGLRRVQFFCANGKVPGAKHMGKQWVIPTDAERPVDGRTKLGREGPPMVYHFPIFLYSIHYSNPSELSEAEQQLLAAQKLRLEGEYLKSIELCRKLLSGYTPPWLAAGIHCTIGFDALLLGMISEYRRAIAEISQIAEADELHREDLLLMAASLRIHGSWNLSLIYAIDPDKLGVEAVVYYKYLLLGVALLSGSLDGNAALHYIRADCVQLEQAGITPAVFAFHTLLGTANTVENPLQERELHLKAAVQLAVENNWVANLAKCYNGAASLIEQYLGSYGSSYTAKLKRAVQASMRNTSVIHILESGFDHSCTYSPEQFQFLLLVSYGYTNEQIACVKDMPLADVRHKIAELCTLAAVPTKAELVKYAKVFFNSGLK